MTLSQPRLRLYTKPSFYSYGLRNLVKRYSQEWVQRAEASICDHTQSRFAIATSLGRTAIYEGLRALLAPGDEIIMPPLTVPDVVVMVALTGAKPIFCDTERGTWNLNPKKLEDLISRKTAAVMTTHLYGITNTASSVRDFCNQHGLHMIEDCAQALGARPDGRAAGTLGDFGILSFSFPKNLTAFGGGMVITDQCELAGTIRLNMSGYPMYPKKRHYAQMFSSALKDLATIPVLYSPLVAPVFRLAYRNDIGMLKRFVEMHLPAEMKSLLPPHYATRLTGLHGRIICDKLPEVPSETMHRIECSAVYHEHLKDLKTLTIPPLATDGSHSYLYYPIETRDKVLLWKYLIEHGRDVADQHLPNCADIPVFAHLACDCPVARTTAANTLMLPCYPKYRLSEAKKTAMVIREYYNR